jgi:hypothetical protein
VSVQTQTAPTKLSPTEEVLNLAKQVAPKANVHEVGRAPEADEQTFSGMEGLVRPLTGLVEARTDLCLSGVNDGLQKAGLVPSALARLVLLDEGATHVAVFPRAAAMLAQSGARGGYILPAYDELHPQDQELRGFRISTEKQLMTRPDAAPQRLSILREPVALVFTFEASLSGIDLRTPQETNLSLGRVVWSNKAFCQAAFELDDAFRAKRDRLDQSDNGPDGGSVEQLKLRASGPRRNAVSAGQGREDERCTLAEFQETFVSGDYLAGYLARAISRELVSESDGGDIIIERLSATGHGSLLVFARFATDLPVAMRQLEISRAADGQLDHRWS